jgi:hypothetical protein
MKEIFLKVTPSLRKRGDGGESTKMHIAFILLNTNVKKKLSSGMKAFSSALLWLIISY